MYTLRCMKSIPTYILQLYLNITVLLEPIKPLVSNIIIIYAALVFTQFNHTKKGEQKMKNTTPEDQVIERLKQLENRCIQLENTHSTVLSNSIASEPWQPV